MRGEILRSRACIVHEKLRAEPEKRIRPLVTMHQNLKSTERMDRSPQYEESDSSCTLDVVRQISLMV